MQAPKLLIFCEGIPHPNRGASVVLYYQYISALRDLGYETHLICLIKPDTPQENKQRLKDDLGSTTFQIDFAEGRRFIVPSVVGFKRVDAVLDPIRDKIQQFNPDLVVCFDVAAAWYAESFGFDAAQMVWLGDLNFDTRWYHNMYAAKEKPMMYLKLPWTALKCRWWRRVYQQALSNSDSIIVSSASSEQKLAQLGLNSAYLPYPWPNISFRAETKEDYPTDLPSFLFFGTLRALGSRSAFHFLFDHLYPEMVKQWGAGNFVLYIAGQTRLPDWVKQGLGTYPEFEFLGFVDDLDGLLDACDAVIAPIDVPVGNRSRIVTAMAKRILAIAHPNTALGNPALIDGETCFLAATAPEFVAAMVRASADGSEIQRIIERAHLVYETQFEPAAASQMLIDNLQALYNRPRLHSTSY